MPPFLENIELFNYIDLYQEYLMNILVTGENGQLGSSIKEISNKYPYKFIFTAAEIAQILQINIFL